MLLGIDATICTHREIHSFPFAVFFQPALGFSTVPFRPLQGSPAQTKLAGGRLLITQVSHVSNNKTNTRDKYPKYSFAQGQKDVLLITQVYNDLLQKERKPGTLLILQVSELLFKTDDFLISIGSTMPLNTEIFLAAFFWNVFEMKECFLRSDRCVYRVLLYTRCTLCIHI